MKTKQECRAYYKQQRLMLRAEERKEKSALIATHYFHLFQIERPQVVHLFLPMPVQAEVDTLFILKKMNEEYPEVKTVTSVIAADGNSLLTIEVRTDSLLKLNRWGIPEPVERILFPEKEIEEILTPLLALDVKGYRLGYGKGFYDRFFQTCSPTAKRTGLNFFPAVENELPKDEWDVRLHRLVSPEGLFTVVSAQ